MRRLRARTFKDALRRPRQGRRHRKARMTWFPQLARVSLIVTLAAGIAAAAAYATYTGSSHNPETSLTAGTVAISDDDAAGTVVSLTDANGGDAATGCIEVHYTGSLAAEVRLYGAASGALASHLDLAITRGSGVSGFPGCGSFVPD